MDINCSLRTLEVIPNGIQTMLTTVRVSNPKEFAVCFARLLSHVTCKYLNSDLFIFMINCIIMMIKLRSSRPVACLKSILDHNLRTTILPCRPFYVFIYIRIRFFMGGVVLLIFISEYRGSVFLRALLWLLFWVRPELRWSSFHFGKKNKTKKSSERREVFRLG